MLCRSSLLLRQASLRASGARWRPIAVRCMAEGKSQVQALIDCRKAAEHLTSGLQQISHAFNCRDAPEHVDTASLITLHAAAGVQVWTVAHRSFRGFCKVCALVCVRQPQAHRARCAAKRLCVSVSWCAMELQQMRHVTCALLQATCWLRRCGRRHALGNSRLRKSQTSGGHCS